MPSSDDEVIGTCPHCGFAFERVTSVDPNGPEERRTVDAGSITVCSECGNLGIVGLDGVIMKLSSEEEAHVHATSQDLLDVAEKAITVMRFEDHA